jgi:hypothetical protein
VSTVVILQSSYLPWKGYFHQIALCDEFVFFDDTQFTKRDWRSRNQIKTPSGLHWLSIPVRSKGRYQQLIQDVRIADPKWAATHWSTIRSAYRRAPQFETHESLFSKLYSEASRLDFLSEVNALFIRGIAQILGLSARISFSSQYPGDAKKTDRLIDICRQIGATDYLSGPSAKSYIEPGLFNSAQIGLLYMDYTGYPQYPQLWGDFTHEVSIIDAIFNAGIDATRSWLRADSYHRES